MERFWRIIVKYSTHDNQAEFKHRKEKYENSNQAAGLFISLYFSDVGPGQGRGGDANVRRSPDGGYDFGKDSGPKGSVAYDEKKNQFVGTYSGLKMPAGRRAIFAWFHDTVNQKSRLVGVVGWLKNGTTGKNKAHFSFKAPDEFKGKNFGNWELLAFTTEKTNLFDGEKAVSNPAAPSGSSMRKSLKPAFYLFSALPGADRERLYCGHGQDFTFAKDQDKQTCYDCICGQKYKDCKMAGMAAHKPS